MKKFVYAILTTLLLASCQDNDAPQAIEDFETQTFEETHSSYAISPDSALAYLNEFWEESEDLSRSLPRKTVSAITPIRYNLLKSRSDTGDIECENLLYVANFEQEQGYAILAADSRIKDKVIAVTEEGSLSDATVYTAMELANSGRVIFQGFPTTGPGFFTLPEYGDEVFMNPNTVSLYDETEDDTLVGNINLDDIGAEDGTGNPIFSDRNEMTIADIFTSSLCTTYAINEIKAHDTPQNEFRTENGDVLIEGGGGSAPPHTETTQSNWSTKKSTPNILYNYRYWSQDTPFNNLYPQRRRYLLFGHRRNAPAGCFPLAIAKVLTHLEYPKTYVSNGHVIDWDGLKPLLRDSTSAAALLRDISEGCDSWYFYKGTFTFPHKATSYMRFLGLSNAHSYKYTFERVTSMIDAGKPLLIYAVPGINVLECHCWNIDGYKIKERTITTKTYIGNTLINSTDTIETCNMVHCDFGWKGTANGYYVSGVFRINDSSSEPDPGPKSDKSPHYNNILKVVMY